MTKKIQILTVALILQVILTVTLTMTGKDIGAYSSAEKLLGLDLGNLDKITISGQEDKTVVLLKKGDSWILPDYFNFPVDQQKLEKVSDKLFEINKPWPVATTDAAEKRFKVADDTFERKIDFASGDDIVKTLFLGTAPSYRNIHARINDQDAIYSIEFGVFETSAEGKDWVKKDYLHIAEDEITEIKLDGVMLKRQGKNFVVTGLDDTKVSNVEEIKKFVDKLSKLSFSEILASEDKPEFQQNTPTAEINVKIKSGDSFSYTLSKLKEKDDFVLKKSSDDYYFKVASYVAETIVDITWEKLVKEKPTESQADNNQSDVDTDTPARLVEPKKSAN